MDMKEAFDIIRVAIKDHQDKEGIPVATALLTVAEELLSKLERIAVAAETSASAVGEHYGIPAIWTKPT